MSFIDLPTGELAAASVPKQRSALCFSLGLIGVETVLLRMEGLLPPPTTTTITLYPLTNASVNLSEESDTSSALEDVATHLRLLILPLSMLVSLAASLLPFPLRSLQSDMHHLHLGVLVNLKGQT